MMGVRMRVHDREPIGAALRRFDKLLHQRSGVAWHFMFRPTRFVPATQYKRKKRFNKRFKARMATLQAQQAGVQPVAALKEARAAFWKRTGKP